jgi:hypothetical protein
VTTNFNSLTQEDRPFRPGAYPPPSPLSPGFSLNTTTRAVTSFNLPYIPPAGYAHAQILSGTTVRLIYAAPGFLTWAPGQHFLLHIPSISKLERHPFTCVSVSDEQSDSCTMIFLVRCRTRWTKKLWDTVVQSPTPHHDIEGLARPPTGMLLKMYVDGPFGSAARARWEAHSTAVILVAGAGVSFGLSVLEYICLCLLGREGKDLGGHAGMFSPKQTRLRRVRFVWLVHDHGEVTDV